MGAQSLWLLPVWGGGQEDLQGHGEAGQLRHTVGHGACRCPEAQQVGNGVDDPSHTEDEEVDPGHCGTGIQQGVDGSKEEEGKDVLHVIAVGPEKRDKVVPSHWNSLFSLIPSSQSTHPYVLLGVSPSGWGRHSPQKPQLSLTHRGRRISHPVSLPWDTELLEVSLCDWDAFATADDSLRVGTFK